MIINDTHWILNWTMMAGLPSLKVDTLGYRTWSRMHFGVVPSWCYSMTLPRAFPFAKYLLACHPAGIQKTKSNGHIKNADRGFIFPYKLMLKWNISKNISKTFNLVVGLVRQLIFQFFSFGHLPRRPIQPIPSTVLQGIKYIETDQEEYSESESCHRRFDTGLVKLALKG